jgi:hypothetical protein
VRVRRLRNPSPRLTTSLQSVCPASSTLCVSLLVGGTIGQPSCSSSSLSSLPTDALSAQSLVRRTCTPRRTERVLVQRARNVPQKVTLCEHDAANMIENLVRGGAPSHFVGIVCGHLDHLKPEEEFLIG